MNRRHTLLALAAVIVRGFGGDRIASASEANLTIPLDKFPRIKLTFGTDEVIISGKEIYDVLRTTPRITF